MKSFKIFSVCFAIIGLFMARVSYADVNVITDDVYDLAMDNEGIGNGDLKKYKNIFKAIDKGDLNVSTISPSIGNINAFGLVIKGFCESFFLVFLFVNNKVAFVTV